MDFYISDVFASEKYSGNQLATFTHCDHLSDREMQNIAREINFSETTFIISQNNNGDEFNVRIFTPVSEIDFAGHPVLGTSYIANKVFCNSEKSKITLHLRAGKIPVDINEDKLWMNQLQPVFDKEADKSFIADMLSIHSSDIIDHFPVLETSTGLPFTIVPLKSLKALKNAKVHRVKYNAFCSSTKYKGILIFSPEGYTQEQALSCRVFVDYLGIPEDPATGSAAGCLAGYLLRTNYFKSKEINICIGQGYEIGRPSLIYIHASVSDGFYSIRIGGKVHHISTGIWN